MDDLRRLTVRVLLAVLVITVVGEFLDAWFFGDKFHEAVPVITLVGGMVSGLFAPEILKTRRNGRSKEATEADDLVLVPPPE